MKIKHKKFSDMVLGESFMIGGDLAIKIQTVLDPDTDHVYNSVLIQDGSLYSAESDECFIAVTATASMEINYAT